MKVRLRALLLRGAALAILGGGYALWISCTGRGLSCPFWKLTGLLCPGCGVTRMCLALLHLDLAGAWRANAALVLALPVLAGLILRLAVRYVRTGQKRPTAGEERIFWGMLVYFLLWGVVRNFVG